MNAGGCDIWGLGSLELKKKKTFPEQESVQRSNGAVGGFCFSRKMGEGKSIASKLNPRWSSERLRPILTDFSVGKSLTARWSASDFSSGTVGILAARL